ncbi:hypothetical protein ESCO_001895 [Escovopsis weberi]|uniref:Uncharacterized protein n=1 Tax=Escovopsis weberi TaxID=150374 RepID=A0A0M9VWX8_ESCWE|nr:hypothetical protein ESCO_001895 [Escovopsis weberi]
MDFAPYQSSPPEHSRISPITSPRASVDTSPFAAAAAARTPPPLQHPQPQRAWNGRDLDGSAGGWTFSVSGFGGGFGGGNGAGGFASSRGGSANAMPGAFPAEISEFDTSLGLRLDYEACLAYLALPPLGAMLLLVLEKNSDYVR